MQKPVLLLEDDADFREAVQFALEPMDYQWFSAETVSQSIEILRANTEIQVIILDIKLGNESGITLLEKLEDVKDRYRTIVLTARDELFDAEAAARHGIFNYILKTDRLPTQSLLFNIEQAFKDIERERLRIKSHAILEIQSHINKMDSKDDLANVLYLVCKHSRKLLTKAHTCHIRVLDESKEDFVLEACAGPNKFPDIHTCFPERVRFGEYFSGFVAESKKPMILGNIQTHAYFKQIKQERLANPGTSDTARKYLNKIKGSYIAPISSGISNNEVDAILNMTSKHKGYFENKRRIKVIEDLASLTTLAIAKYRLQQKRHRIHENYKSISHMIAAIKPSVKRYTKIGRHL